jgi:hypothetical protein
MGRIFMNLPTSFSIKRRTNIHFPLISLWASWLLSLLIRDPKSNLPNSVESAANESNFINLRSVTSLSNFRQVPVKVFLCYINCYCFSSSVSHSTVNFIFSCWLLRKFCLRLFINREFKFLRWQKCRQRIGAIRLLLTNFLHVFKIVHVRKSAKVGPSGEPMLTSSL